MDLFAQMIEELKLTRYPIMLYGIGFCSKKIVRYLKENGISFNGFVVDRKYLPEEQHVMEKPIYAIEEFVQKHACNIIVAFAGISEAAEVQLSNNVNVKALYALDFEGKLTIGGDSQIHETFLLKNRAVLSTLRSDLSDAESRSHLDAFICQKSTGNLRKPYSNKPQYFDDDIIKLGKNEIFVDCGAYDGDSIFAFIKCLKSYGISKYDKIFAFEADSSSAKKLRKNIGSLDSIAVVPKAVLDDTGFTYFSNDSTSNSTVVDGGGAKVHVTTIDETVGTAKVTFIKMDIEGAELRALKGAEKTIRRCKPKLAICVYHRYDDLTTIPQYIQSLNSDYRLFFRNYSAQGIEAVLYAV